MKWLFATLLICVPVLFGCSDYAPLSGELAWPDENSMILFEIKDTSQEDFIDQLDKCTCVSDDDKADIKKWLSITGYPIIRMAKWKQGRTVIMTIDQYIPKQGYDSQTGESCELRSGYAMVWYKLEGEDKWRGYEFNYD